MSEEKNPLTQGAGPGPSSDSASAAASLANEAELSAQSSVPIPEGYSQNRLVLLPVNAHTQHFYWEIADDAIAQRLLRQEIRLEVQLYIFSQENRRLVESIAVYGARGNYYAYHTPNLQQMEAELYLLDAEGKREPLLTSNRITGPSSGMHASPWEIWMTKKGKEQKLESRPSDTTPAPEALVNPSSLDLVLRAEQIRARMGDMALGNPSSDFASGHLFSSDEMTKGHK